MEALSKKEIAHLSYEWGKATTEKKALLYQYHEESRDLYRELPDDKFFLLKRLNDTLVLELVRSDYDILNRGSAHAQTIARVLSLLTDEESIQAFLHINDHGTMQAVMDYLKSSSRARVDKALTQNTIEKMEGVRKDPKERNPFLATEGFLATLEKSMRTCASDQCIGNKNHIPFENYTRFWMTRCLTRSYHLACN